MGSKKGRGMQERKHGRSEAGVGEKTVWWRRWDGVVEEVGRCGGGGVNEEKQWLEILRLERSQEWESLRPSSSYSTGWCHSRVRVPPALRACVLHEGAPAGQFK